MFSHHSHSGQFCSHAKGSLEEVVVEAIRRGFTTYALTEHMPRYRAEDLYPEEVEAGLTADDLARTFDAFLDEAERLRDVYASRITLLVGLETESVPRAELDRLLARHAGRIELLVGSVHHVRSIPIDFDRETFDRAMASMPGASRSARLAALVGEYLDDQHALLEHLRPSVIGHFDVVKLFEPDFDLRADPEVWQRVERNVRLAIGYGALFEVNAAAFRKGWTTAYPGRDVLRLIKSLGGRLTLSDDSHGPHAVGLHYDDARRYLDEEGVTELWRLEPAKRRGDWAVPVRVAKGWAST